MKCSKGSQADPSCSQRGEITTGVSGVLKASECDDLVLDEAFNTVEPVDRVGLKNNAAKHGKLVGDEDVIAADVVLDLQASH